MTIAFDITQISCFIKMCVCFFFMNENDKMVVAFLLEFSSLTYT